MFNPADPPSLAVMLGKESELNWEARDRFLDALIGYCNETRSRLSYSFSGIGAFSGSFVDLRASMQLLPANDPRLMMAHWLKANYEDILLVVRDWPPPTPVSLWVCFAAWCSCTPQEHNCAYGHVSLSRLMRSFSARVYLTPCPSRHCIIC